jgi:hypothetical protein
VEPTFPRSSPYSCSPHRSYLTDSNARPRFLEEAFRVHAQGRGVTDEENPPFSFCAVHYLLHLTPIAFWLCRRQSPASCLPAEHYALKTTLQESRP